MKQSDKKSFVLYTDMLTAISLLTDEQAGQVFKAIFRYQNGEKSNCSDPTANFYFMGTLQPMFERDNRKYEEARQRRVASARKAIQARWARVKKNGTIRDVSNEYETIRDVSKDTVSVSDSVSGSVSGLSKDNKRESIKEKGELSLSRTRNAHAECDPKLRTWIEANAPYIYKHFEHLVSTKELNRLLETYTKDAICETISAIENRADLRRKYKNLYRTLLNWQKKGGQNG